MTVLHVFTDADNAWPDLRDRQNDIIHLKGDFSIARLPRGMVSGASSVAIRIDLPDGKVLITETSMANFLNCARIFNAAEEKLNES